VRAQIPERVPGEVLPSLRRRAYDELEREGLIDTVAGKGLSMASPPFLFVPEPP
jgi:hypothetical protein